RTRRDRTRPPRSPTRSAGPMANTWKPIGAWTTSSSACWTAWRPAWDDESMSVTSESRVLALLGDPVQHSASPRIQNAALERAGLDGVYVALRCGPDDVVGLMRGLARAGGGGNVTLPHKERAAGMLDVASDAVRRTGACNTFWGDEEGRL